MYGHLKAMYMHTMINGIAHIIAKLLNPDVARLYRPSKNRRNSNNTLPPCSWVYVLNASVILFCVTIFNCSQPHLRHTIYKVIKLSIWRQLTYELLNSITLTFRQIHIK